MSLTVEVRAADGTSSAAVTTVGQTLNLQVLAVITAGTADTSAGEVDLTENDPSSFGLLDLIGSFVSTGIYSGDVGGDMSAAVTTEFHSNGYQDGTPQDLNGDGNLDVGGTDPEEDTGYFDARAAAAEHDGTVTSTSMTFVIGTLTYSVTHLNQGGETDINFVPRPTDNGSGGAYLTAVWDDGVGYPNGQGAYIGPNNADSTFQGGTPFVITDQSLNPAPVVNADNVSTQRNSPLTFNALGNVTTSDALVTSSVAIGTQPTNGTASVLIGGAILYTPNQGFTGTDTFTYNVADSNGRTSNNGLVTISVVTPPPPVAVADTASTFRNQPVTVSVLANDTDPSTGTIVASDVAVAAQPTNGTAAVQSDGTILYTPATGFVGTDSFTYTDTDSLDDTSAPATVTVTVTAPPPPVANDDTHPGAVEGGSSIISVLLNDTSSASALDPTSVKILTAPAHGSAVPQADGTILYTADNRYVGPDSFTYTVADLLGDISNPATVTTTVVAAAPPTANNFTAPVVFTPTIPINLIANSSSVATLDPTSFVITTAPTEGTVTVDSTTGEATYTPTPGFVGTDTFAFTVGDTNGLTSSPGTVTIHVGTQLSGAKNGNRSLTFIDSSGAAETITINKGTAGIAFSGSGTVTSKNGKAAIAGTSLEITDLDLSGTTRASSLVVRSASHQTSAIGEITDTAPIGSITAKATAVTGDITLAGIGSLTVAGMSTADSLSVLTIGAAGPVRPRLSLGAVNAGTTINSSVSIGSLQVSSWVYGAFATPDDVSQGGGSSLSPGTIYAPSIGSIVSAGDFGAGVALSPTGATLGLTSVRIGGQLTGVWSDTGGAGPITAESVSQWNASFKGRLAALTVHGNLAGSITAGSVQSINVSGSIDQETLTIDDAAGIGQIIAGSLIDSTIRADAAAADSLTTATAADLGDATIGNIRLTGRSGNQFSNTSIFADKIRSISLRSVNTDNSGTPEGIAAVDLTTISAIIGSNVHLGHGQLASEAELQSYLSQQSISFGDFAIEIP